MSEKHGEQLNSIVSINSLAQVLGLTSSKTLCQHFLKDEIQRSRVLFVLAGSTKPETPVRDKRYHDGPYQILGSLKDPYEWHLL